MAKRNKTISIEDDMFNELSKELNASKLIDELLRNYYGGVIVHKISNDDKITNRDRTSNKQKKEEKIDPETEDILNQVQDLVNNDVLGMLENGKPSRGPAIPNKY